MPHFLNRQNLDRIESKVRPYFESTSSHRFRQSKDLQYSFMYFHFIKAFEMEKKQAYYDSLWDRYLDTDHDGILNANELRTLASIVYKDNVNDEYESRNCHDFRNIEKLRNCLTPEIETVETYSDLFNEYERVTKRRKFITYPLSNRSDNPSLVRLLSINSVVLLQRMWRIDSTSYLDSLKCGILLWYLR